MKNTYIFRRLNTNVTAPLHVKIDDSINEAFRIAVIRKFGSKKGSLAKGVEEAILLWLENEGYSEIVGELRKKL